jgi:type I restriction enzyme S subunit
MEDWKTYKLSQIAEIIGGGTPSTSKPDYWNGEISWLTPKDLTNYEYRYISNGERSITQKGLNNSSARLLPKDTVLMSSRAPIGYLAIAENELCTNQGFKSFILDNEKVDTTFFYYLLKSKVEFIKSLGTGTTFAEVSATKLKGIEFDFPKLKDQKAIAKILSSLDDKIELNRKMNATLEEMARAVFKAWFVDFEPVLANADNQPSTSASPEIAKLFPAEFQESELGLIPKGWEVNKVGETVQSFDFVANGSFASLKKNVTTYDQPEFALYIRTTDFNSDFGGNLKYVDESSFDYLSKSYLKGDETIISNVGDVGTVFRPPVWLDMPMTLGSNAVGIRYKNPSYIQWYFKSNFGQHQIRSITTGSAQLKFNKTNLRNLDLLLPTETILDKFDEFEESLNNYSNLLKKESLRLSEIRDSLLPRLISGKIAVGEIEKEVADAM